MLSLAEELLLLSLDDDKGTIAGSVEQALGYGLAAAGIVDLLLADRLAVDGKKKLSVVDAAPTGDELLDEMLVHIQQSKRTKSIGDWVRDFGNGGIKKIQERLERRLVNKGILRDEEGKYLKLIPWHHYPTVDGAPEAETRERLREILLEGREPDARTAILISLVRASTLLNQLFPKAERKRADQRANEIAKGEVAGEAVSQAVEEAVAVTVAAMVAASAAGAASTTSS